MSDNPKSPAQINFDELKKQMLEKYSVSGKLAEYAFLIAWEERYKENAGAIEKFFRALVPLFLPPRTGDAGHDLLLCELGHVYHEAYEYEYHDFKNKKYATPKMALMASFEVMIQHVKDGKYDNAA